MIDIKIENKIEFIPKNITKDQAKDTGMAMVLIFLLIGSLGEKHIFISLAIPLLLIDMILPDVYRPVAKIWFGLSHLMGTLMSKLILTILFFIIVTPVGLIRRLSGADPLQINKWKKNHSTVFRVRDHKFSSEDIKAPY